MKESLSSEYNDKTFIRNDKFFERYLFIYLIQSINQQRKLNNKRLVSALRYACYFRQELRVIIWNTTEVVLEEESITGEKMSDIYVKG